MIVPAVCAETRATAAATTPAGPVSPASAKASASKPAADPFARSPTAAAARDLAAAPPIDSAKVADLRARIAAGTYVVDPAQIAAKMIELDLPE